MRYKHDCTACVYLGSVHDVGDLYFCEQPDWERPYPTLVWRRSSEPRDYDSWPFPLVGEPTDEPFVSAMMLARGRGLVPEPLNESQWWWLSFADGRRPAGSQFLGALVIGPAWTMGNAIIRAHREKLNPGGEVMTIPIPPEKLALIPAEFRMRLLSRERCAELEALLK